MAPPVLVVDDDPKIVSLVRTYLEREGLPVVTATDGMSALDAIATQQPCLVVLDLMLPELDGLAVLRIVREHSDVPIVVLSARGTVADRVYGIHEGADDYVPKPFSPAELVARVKAVLRRTADRNTCRAPTGILTYEDLTIDLERFQVFKGGRPVPLTPVEFRLLAALVQADGRVLTRQALLDSVYGPAQLDVLERTIDVHIGRLREKLGEVATHPRYIATSRGAGYRTTG